MRKYLILLFLLASAVAFPQKAGDGFANLIEQVKSQTVVDRKDISAMELFEAFYREVLQSDAGEFRPETTDRLQRFMQDEKSKNKHLLIILLMYQRHLEDTVAKGLPPNGSYQVAMMDVLESEFQSVYGVLPAIVYIFKSEALEADGKHELAETYVADGLEKFPDSVSLKVYRYLSTKDESIRQDLIANHSGHWMVIRKRIR